MPNPHFDISITQRSKGKSAVAGAAYQSGDKLFCEYDQKYKNYTRKQGVVYTEIMLPANAPTEYADRETLWNAAEAVEKQWNSQLARRFVLTFPREIPSEHYPQMVRDYCMEHFVSKGMCCDFAIHDPSPPGHNPHCHVMLTMRAMDEHGKWLPKSRKVYDLDENGERIRLPSGNWKCHKENTVDWNEQYHGEEWRHGWEVVQNRYLEMIGSAERVDLRSYERQGLDTIPTVHMGPAVTQMERRGMKTNIGNLNRDIRAANRMMRAIRNTISSLRDWIAAILEARKELLAELDAANQSPSLSALLNDYMELRKAERSEWSKYGQRKGSLADLQAVSKAVSYLSDHDLTTLKNLDESLEALNTKVSAVRTEMRRSEKRLKTIDNIQRAVATCQTHKAIYDKYVKIGWKTAQNAFAEKHKSELDAYNKAFRYLKKQGVDLSVDLKKLRAESDDLTRKLKQKETELRTIQNELKPMEEIRHWVGKVLSANIDAVEKKVEPRYSIREMLKDLQPQSHKPHTTHQQQKDSINKEH